MDTFHNPDRYMSDLRQILSQGRKRIALLVGAGAPLAIRVSADGRLSDAGAPLIPGVEDLTRAAIAGLDPTQEAAVAAIREDLGANANIETILSRIRLLQQALGTTKVNGLDGTEYSDLGKAICEKIGAVVAASLPLDRNAYTELVAWVSGTLRAHSVEIFTTNYDLLFEEAFEHARAPYFDGFSGGSSPFFDSVSVASDDLPARWSRLWKLHGSIGWALENGSIVRGKGRTATQLVYPDHLKYDLTQKQPYSALFERLKHFLLSPDTLLMSIGFSFRDAHICAVLDEALAMNANTAVIAFQYRNRQDEEPACRLALDRPNLSVYAADGAVIGGVSGSWRPGDLPKHWAEIRSTFWGQRQAHKPEVFLLGDFAHFARFCALAQATDLKRPAPPEETAPAEHTSTAENSE
ncbi:SIR2 family NAD-dependent protein deacylase [Burkholderia pseudomallei]|uniref:SIR2 family NAD-dependent protein deacylase n=1 Tax=Burkholderia pseudomallei TaxID=28450 RepID=UPI001E49D3D0|nr:SIR2 family protein [Burkholderia pseudomallei]